MAVDPDIAPDLRDPPVAADQHGGAQNAKKGFAIHGFFAPGPVGLQHFMLLVRNQGNSQFVLVPELLLRLERIGRDAEHRGPTRGEGPRRGA